MGPVDEGRDEIVHVGEGVSGIESANRTCFPGIAIEVVGMID
jgi:hypothetical protein